MACSQNDMPSCGPTLLTSTPLEMRREARLLGKAARPSMMPASMRVARQQPAVVKRPARPVAAYMPTLQAEPSAAAPAAPADEFDDFMSSMKELGAM